MSFFKVFFGTFALNELSFITRIKASERGPCPGIAPQLKREKDMKSRG